jgi:enterochelin esterase-like enzyme
MTIAAPPVVPPVPPVTPKGPGLRRRWSLPRPWGPYAPPGAGRDERIDLLRGYAVFAMVVDHIGGPSFLYALTGGNRFYTSAAEAFIFISGLVMGLVYRRLIERDGLGISLRRAIERSVTLYLVTITLTLFFVPLSEVLALHWAQGVDFRDPLAFVVSVLTLHRTYYLVDIPLLYTILILVSPLALVLLSQGRTAVVVVTSWLLWLAYQYFPQEAELPWSIAGNYLFYVSSWQVFFFTGLALGWHHQELTTRLARFPRRAALIASGIGTALLVLFYRFTNRLGDLEAFDPQAAQDVQLFLIEYVFGKADVRPGRIVASVIVFAFLYLLVTELWVPIRRFTGWLLVPLGQNALYAYAAHVVLAVPITIAMDQLLLPDRMARPLSAAVQIGTVLFLWLLIKGRILFVNPARGIARYAWPVSAICAALLITTADPSRTMPGLAISEVEPDPYASRVARAFGTPVPGRPHPAERVVELPTPRPSLRQVQIPALTLEERVARYIGAIRGTVHHIQFYSPALGRDMRYFVYVPPGYENEDRRYPVLYMLHGNSGSYEEWLAYGLISAADGLIAAREILPMIVVLPQGDFSYWVNHGNNGPRYGDYMAIDLVRHINATWRILPGPEHRAIGGLSMGGTGALVNAFTYPRVFGVAGAHSPALPADGERDFLGTGREFAQRDPIALAGSRRDLNRLSIWIDIGDEDMWLERTDQLHEALESAGVDHEYNVFPGDHWGPYWSEHIPDYLRFYDAALNPLRRL